jgi:hypothetical protein
MAAANATISREMHRAAVRAFQALDQAVREAHASYNRGTSTKVLPTNHPQYREIEHRERTRLRLELKRIEAKRAMIAATLR